MLKANRPIFTPNTVYKSTKSPKIKINIAITEDRTIIDRAENINISTGCVRNIVNGVKQVAE